MAKKISPKPAAKKKGGLPSETTTLTPAQAGKKLRERKYVSEKQKGFFGAVRGKAGPGKTKKKG